jgi:CubicO group peptidase (beta-lactamase class C family)
MKRLGKNRFGFKIVYVTLAALFLTLVCQQVLATTGNDTDQLGMTGDKLSDFDHFIQETMETYEVPGAVVVIVQDDQVVLLKGYGVRDVGKPEPVDENTRFQIGSVTKLVTATALGVLVDEGKLEWDIPIIEYIPEFAMKDPYATLHATIRDMLAHRSGLRAFDGDLLNRLGYDRAEVLHKVRFMEPGCSFREVEAYSNVGIFIAGEVGAQAGNSTWEGVVISRIFQPLDMNRSSPYHEAMYYDENHASGHIGSGDELQVMPLENVSVLAAAGEAVSTGSDMARWLRMLLAEGSFEGTQILEPQTVREIFRPSMVASLNTELMNDTSGANGLGCNIFNFLGYTVVEKNGALDGMKSIVVLVPEKKLGLAVLSNKHITLFPEAVRAEFLELFLGASGKDLQERIRMVQRHWDEAVQPPNPPKLTNPPCKDLGAYTGNYTSKLYEKCAVIRDGNDLRIEVGPTHYPGKLQHWTDNTFLLTFPDPDDAPGLITFIISSSGNVSGFVGEDYLHGFMMNYGYFKKEV